MRSLFGNSRLKTFARGSLLAAILVISATHQGDNALGQSQSPAPPFQPPTTGPGSGRPPFGQETETNQDPMVHHAQQEAARRRNIDRQNKLVADSSRIVQLANELNAGVEPNEKDTTSGAMSKKAEEIEKLARSVKELMKSE
jgi:hypothetical protein